VREISPIASVVVTTYNSEQFVLETLDSVKAQTYSSIELIVSDDCSTDNTVEVCREWLVRNRGRFVRTDIITVQKNTGVSGNCNRSIAAAKSDWIKFIAGDDILLPSCIEMNMDFVAKNSAVMILFSQVLLYRNYFTDGNFMKKVPEGYPMNIMDPDFTADDQFQLLLLSDRINFTPSYFFNKTAIQSVGGYDEENKIVEDYPMWLKLTKAGYKLYFMEKATVGYRQHSNALNNTGDNTLFKPLFLKMFGFRKKAVHPYLPWDTVGSEKQKFVVSKVFQVLGLNRNTPFLRSLYLLLTIYLNPFQYIRFFKKRVHKKGSHDIFYKY
jgi:glycosyltransferase involved in cell wall biosynthesis